MISPGERGPGPDRRRHPRRVPVPAARGRSQPPVILPRNAEPALGMALLAASRGRQSTDVAAEMVQTDRIIDPPALSPWQV
ncbi:hypothetical protein [Pseudarthrobacter sp. S9]|uniref:hypothetical protein n=1 Tax=Pseudarthrobacter sp. S9 TaxID=3418421 RepID=UPI003D0159F5